MEVILLERIGKLGKFGDTVRVKDGYARNFLIPRKKALRASDDNKALFEAQKAKIEAENQARKQEAEKLAKKLEGLSVTVIRQAAEDGRLYGSVTPRDVSVALKQKGFEVAARAIILAQAVKTLGEYPVRIELHAEVSVDVSLAVARSSEESAA